MKGQIFIGMCKIKLNFKDVEPFTRKLDLMGGVWDLYQGRYIVNAKSILGICSLDLESPMELHSDHVSDRDISLMFQRFIVNE